MKIQLFSEENERCLFCGSNGNGIRLCIPFRESELPLLQFPSLNLGEAQNDTTTLSSTSDEGIRAPAPTPALLARERVRAPACPLHRSTSGGGGKGSCSGHQRRCKLVIYTQNWIHEMIVRNSEEVKVSHSPPRLLWCKCRELFCISDTVRSASHLTANAISELKIIRRKDAPWNFSMGVIF